ncbi:MAG: phytoene/squalene synthase family protein, partial [Limisphaerales bacterium]
MASPTYMSSSTPHPESPLLTSLLRDVSRSFYLTMRVLPQAIRPQISLAYLLARATDTIADTELLPVDERLAALRQLRDRVLGERELSVNFGKLADRQTNDAERVLLERVEEALAVFSRFTYSDQQRIRDVIDTITSGQELDLQRFRRSEPEQIIALNSDEELDDYTYRVAGCVGEFWTKICRGHLFPNTPLDDATLIANGVRFGQGLQLINILRDLPRDLQEGRCYLPSEKLDAIGLRPADLRDFQMESAFRALYHGYLDRAFDHLQAGWSYTNSLPRRFIRLRLACAWPILIGIDTIQKLRKTNILTPSNRVKVSRSEVYAMIIKSVIRYPFPPLWRGLFP